MYQNVCYLFPGNPQDAFYFPLPSVSGNSKLQKLLKSKSKALVYFPQSNEINIYFTQLVPAP